MTTPRFITAATYKVYIPSAPVQAYTIASPVYHLTFDGIATPSVLRQFQPYPNGDGGVDQGFRLQPRQMAWRLFIDASSEIDLEDRRNEIYRNFRASEQLLQLEVTRADGAKRSLDCHVSGPIEFRESAQVGYSCEAIVPLYAPEPSWYNPTENQYFVSGWGATSAAAQIDYLGNWFAYPQIVIDGQFVDLVLEDINGTTIDFTGHTIASGDTYTIDLRPAAKTATDGSGTDVAAYIVSDLWSSFGIYPGPLAGIGTPVPMGHNTIQISYASRGAGSAIEIRYYDRFLNL
jgi:hypothetical protein